MPWWLQQLLVNGAIYLIFFGVGAVIVISAFAPVSEWVGRRYQRHKDGAERIVAALSAAALLGLFQIALPWFQSEARALGLLRGNQLLIFAPDGAATPAARMVERIARDLGFEDVWIGAGREEDHGNVPRIVWFNGPGEAPASDLERAYEAEFGAIALCPDTVTPASEGVVELFFPDPGRPPHDDECDPPG